MSLFSSIKKYPKDYIKLAIVVVLGIIAVMGAGGGFSDYSEKKGWQIFWDLLAFFALVALIIGWIILYTRDKRANKK